MLVYVCYKYESDIGMIRNMNYMWNKNTLVEVGKN